MNGSFFAPPSLGPSRGRPRQDALGSNRQSDEFKRFFLSDLLRASIYMLLKVLRKTLSYVDPF